MKSSYLAGFLVFVFALAATGCGPTDITFTKKSSYADLVVTYNAELETLEKLEVKRKAVISDYFGQAQGKAIQAAVNSIGTGDGKKMPTNPNQALDQAVAAAELQAGLLEGLGVASDSAESAADYPEELKVKLADLDTEIAEQKQRVQRAKDARDAAEPK